MAVSSTFETLLLRHAARAYEKQMFLGTLIGSRDWFYDLKTGKLHFGKDIAFNMQLIGTEGYASSTWLWSWANTASSIPPQLLAAAQTIRAYGEQMSIPALVTPHISLNEHYNGHYMAMVSSGVFKANAYYRAPYDDGALFLLIDDPDYPQDARHTVTRIQAMFPQFISQVPLYDHRATFTGYLESYDMVVKTDERKIRGIHPEDRSEVTAEFDEHKRLTRISSRLTQE